MTEPEKRPVRSILSFRAPRNVDEMMRAVVLTRASVFVVGLMFLVAERGLSAPYVFGTLLPDAPLLWNIVFLVAGFTTVAWAMTLQPIFGKFSLVTLVAAMSSRAAGLYFLVPDPPLTPVAMYGALIVVILWSWPRAMYELDADGRDWVRMERRSGPADRRRDHGA